MIHSREDAFALACATLTRGAAHLDLSRQRERCSGKGSDGQGIGSELRLLRG